MQPLFKPFPETQISEKRMTVIQLEPKTITVLRTFARMNPGIVIHGGNTIQTINYGRTVYGRAIVSQTFDREIAIDDLPQILSLCASPTITIEGERIAVQDDTIGGKLSFPLSKPERILSPPGDKEPSFDKHPVDTRFSLPQDKLQAIQKVGKKLKKLDFSNVIVTGANGRITLSMCPRYYRHDDENYPVFEFGIGDTDQEFKVSLSMQNLQMLIPGDYSVQVSYWVSKGGPLAGLAHFAAPDVDYRTTVEGAQCIPVNQELLHQQEAARAEAQRAAAELSKETDLNEMIKKLDESEIAQVRSYIRLLKVRAPIAL
jgi:hypothetical protein